MDKVDAFTICTKADNNEWDLQTYGSWSIGQRGDMQSPSKHACKHRGAAALKRWCNNCALPQQNSFSKTPLVLQCKWSDARNMREWINSRIFSAQKVSSCKSERTFYALIVQWQTSRPTKQRFAKVDYSGTSIMHTLFMWQPTFTTNWGPASTP